MPMGIGAITVAAFTTPPSQVMKLLTPGPTNLAAREPATITAMGVSTISTLVLPDTKRPTSQLTTAAM